MGGKLVQVLVDVGVAALQHAAAQDGDIDFKPAGYTLACRPAKTASVGLNQRHKSAGEAKKICGPHHKFRKKCLQARGGPELSGDLQKLVKIALLRGVKAGKLGV